MGTAEILVVFSALMALVALMTIGIDWIGKPLKHRRFIPRMYRFEDEKLPIDAYGHTDFELHQPPAAAPPSTPAPYLQPAPVVVAQLPMAEPAPTVATPAVQAAAVATAGSGSAFSDSLLATTSGSTPAVAQQITGADNWLADDRDPPVTPPSPEPATGSALAWEPGMALDTTINDRKPNLATKAQRFWKSTAIAAGGSHFDSDDVARMQAGKPPRRSNPRSGRAEAMQLSGLRQASQPDQVRMRWPEESIDPWN